MADTNDHRTVGDVATRVDPLRGQRRALAARGAAVALVLGILALVLQAAATAVPAWGEFYNPDAGIEDKGYFGPWRQCKLLLYGREKCGDVVTRFQPVFAVWIAGLAAVAASIFLGVLVGLAVLQLAMASSAKKVVLSYSTALIGKVTSATLATLLAIIAAILFASQTDDKTRGFVIVRADGFYMQLGAIVLNFSVFVSSVYEGIYARRGGDPTKLKEYTETPGTTINNPGYREHHPRNGGGISMTDASGKPYVCGTKNGSMASVATAGSISSTGSPLRSSLKKPRTLGIQNPGYSAHSPTFTRNGSQKKPNRPAQSLSQVPVSNARSI